MVNIISLRSAIILAVFSISALAQDCPKKKLVVCYWASWATYRGGNGAHFVDQIVPDYCTHLVYSFAGLNLAGELDSLDFNKDITNGGYKKLVALKAENPCIKILLGIGGWNEGSEKYSLMAESEAARTKFAEKVLQFLVYFGFDGVDLDWEYPSNRGGISKDKENFIALLKALNKKLKPRKRTVSAAVSAAMSITKSAYDINEMCAQLDFVSIMGYDLHDPHKTSIHSPLYLENNEPQSRDTIDRIVNFYKKEGCPSNKIILGIPTFGRTYTLEDEDNVKVGAAVKEDGKEGEYSKQKGFLGFNEICEMLRNEDDWTVKFMPKNAAKYAWNADQWVSYDDPSSVTIKAKYVLEKELGGVMFWSIDTDDFRGKCYDEPYPILIAANKALGNFD